MIKVPLEYSFHVDKAIASFIRARKRGMGRQMMKDIVDELCTNNPL